MNISESFLDQLELEQPNLKLQDELQGHPGVKTIHTDALEVLTDEILLFIANIVATLIDAGSEREVVLENEDLHDAIFRELSDWS